MRPRSWAVQGIVLGLLLAACTGSAGAPVLSANATTGSSARGGQATAAGQAGGTTTLPDSCYLLTPDEIKAQFTVDIAAGTGSAVGGGPSPECIWNPTAYQVTFSSVTLRVEAFDQSTFDLVRSTSPSHKDVAALGDDAVFQQLANPTVLHVRKGDLQFSLVIAVGGSSTLSPDALQQAVINLAKDALARL